MLAPLAIARSEAADPARELIERGRYLATAADCVACHTRKDGAPYAGGLAMKTPYGTIYTPNITPDPDAGLGRWSDEQFYRALHFGVADDGSRLYPAFPYPYYTQLARADTDAIRAYLASLAPDSYRSPANELRFPFNQRPLLRLWNLLFLAPGKPQGLRSAQPQLERGRFLIEALGHCGACHSPKNFLGADQDGAHLGGAEVQGSVAVNLTADSRSGLHSWSQAQLVEYLKSGRNAHALATGAMREVIEKSTSWLTDEDLQAMAAYLKSLPAGGHDAAPLPLAPAVRRAGEAIYIDECTACHRSDGTALPRAFAPLQGSATVQATLATSVIRIVLEGARAATTDATPTAFAMPAFRGKLDDQQVADVVTYVRNAWGNLAPPVDALAVARVRKVIASEGSQAPRP